MNQERKNLLVFGYGLVVIFLFLSLKGWYSHGWKLIYLVLMALAGIMFAITVYNLTLLKKIYTRWMKVAHVIGNIVTTVLLSILFYLLFGAIGIVLRLFGKDLLDQEMDKDRKSYWIKEDIHFQKDSYKQQY